MTEWLTKEEYTERHGAHVLADCFEAVVEKYEDGFILCPIEATGGTCEECYEVFERRTQ